MPLALQLPQEDVDPLATELRSLRSRVLLMGGRVEEMVYKAVRALVERDRPLAQRAQDLDQQIDADQIDIDRLGLELLDRHRPSGLHLRQATVLPRMAADLERMGDLSANICRRAWELSGRAPGDHPREIGELAELAEDMVRRALEALADDDAPAAELILAIDAEVDALYQRTFADYLRQAQQPGADVERFIRLQHAAKDLERIADHATNLAELVIFMVEGREVRAPAFRRADGTWHRPEGRRR